MTARPAEVAGDGVSEPADDVGAHVTEAPTSRATATGNRVRVVFIHGAFVRDGTWWWAPVATLLDQDGITREAVALGRAARRVAVTGSGPGLQIREIAGRC